MWRYFVGVAGALVLAVSAFFLLRGSAASEPRAAMARAPEAAAAAAPLPDAAPRASDRTREEKRFDRYDKDRDDKVSREEYLASRRKAFARLDTDHDGRLSFDEWALRTTGKFAGADSDKSGTLDRKEFAATAPKRRASPKCACPQASRPTAAPPAGDGEGEE